MELLNLDDLVGKKRPVVLNGKEYEIKEQTIQQMIESVRSQKTLDRDDVEAMFESMLSTAIAILPDAPEADLRALNIKQLQALINFASATDEEVEAAAEAEEAEGK